MRRITLVLSSAALAMSGGVFAQTTPVQTAPVQTRSPKPDMTRAQAQARAEAAFARMDANKDGTLNEADRAARQAGAFDRMDTDRNGSISRAEFAAMQSQRAGRDGKAVSRMGHKGPGAHPGARAGRLGSGANPMTRQAFVDRALTMFDRADANRDGTVTRDERKAVRDTVRQQRQARQQG